MKTISAGLQTHIEGRVTTLTSIWRIIRPDGQNFYLTSHDRNIIFDDGDGAQTYTPVNGFNRSAIVNRVGLSVDNLNATGLLDSTSISLDDIRAGLFDKSDVRFSIVNWADLSQGAIRARRGLLGEAKFSRKGGFTIELRGMTEYLSQVVTPLTAPECRADLGDATCMIPIEPPLLERSMAVELGQYYTVATRSPDTLLFNNIINNGSFEFGIVGTDVTPGGWTVLTGDWNVETGTVNGLSADDGVNFLKANVATLSQIEQVVVLEAVGVDLTEIDAGNCEVDFTSRRAQNFASDTGRLLVTFLDANDLVLGTILDTGTESISPTDTWVSRDALAVSMPANTRKIRVFFESNLVAGGSNDSALDNVVCLVRQTTTSSAFQESHENRIYQVTTAGTTDVAQPVYDTTPGNDTTDGTAVLTAEEAWTREAEILYAADRQNLHISVTDVRAVAGWFDGGVLAVETGSNAGISMEIKTWDDLTGLITLFLPFPFAFEAGTKIKVVPGCNKRFATCINRFANAINYQGEPFLPGDNQLQILYAGAPPADYEDPAPIT